MQRNVPRGKLPPDNGEYELLTAEQVAEYLSMTRQGLTLWREAGVGPEYIAISARNVRYPRAGLIRWLDANRIKPKATLAECVSI